MAEVVKRRRMTPEEKAASFDERIQVLKERIAKKTAIIEDCEMKIKAAQAEISTLEAKKKAALTPKPPSGTKRQKVGTLIKLAEAKGMQIEDIAKKLNIKLQL